jgi:hypothetical protein
MVIVMVLYYDDPSLKGQGRDFQAHFVLEIPPSFRLILYWKILDLSALVKK